MKLVSILATLLFLISGCQTAMEMQKGSQKGIANSYSCEQITSTFGAYQRDKTAITPLLEIAKMTGLNIDQTVPGFVPSTYFEKVKASANIALLVQGCTPL